MNGLKQNLAEFIGTFFLVFFGCGAMILNELDLGVASHSIAIIFGGVVSIMIYSVGHISGAHFNPAVSVAFFVTKKISLNKLISYVWFQVLGAIFASYIHYIMFSENHSFGQTQITQVSLFGGILMEFLLSFVLMFVIMSVATDSRAIGELAGVAIGTTVALCAFVGGPITNASMNPARSIGPSLFTGQYSQLWIYILVPIVGAICGAISYEFIKCFKDEDSGAGGCC